MSNTVVVRYETRTESAAENQRLIEGVFEQLHDERPDGLRYAAFRLADGVGFVHVVETSGDGDSPLTKLSAFDEFQRGARERMVAPPMRSEANLVGAYRFAGAERGSAAVSVALAFVDAFGRRDLAAVADALAEDVVFTSPRTTITGAAAVTAAIGEFAEAVTGVTVVDAFGDNERAMVMYDMWTTSFGTLRAVDRIEVRDGRIVSDSVVFDTRPLSD